MFEVDILECFPEFLVGVGEEGIEVLSHSALEDEGRLRDDGDGCSESGETDEGSRDIVEEDRRRAITLDETEESLEERRLTSSCSADYSYLHLGVDSEVEALKDWVEVFSVSKSGVLESNGSLSRPLRREL